MKKKILLFTLVAGISVIAFSSYHAGAGNSGYDCTGAEAACTGTYAEGAGCTYSGGCHSTTATSGINVTVELDSAGTPTTHYKGGLTYTVKITGNNTTGLTLPKYGFQLSGIKGTASAATVSDAGTWSTTVPTSTHIAPPTSPYTYLNIAEQSTAITLTGTSFTQTFTWTAPATGTGSISFYGVANFVNGNGNADAGDKWNNTNLVIAEWVHGVSVPELTNSMEVKVFPNPVVNNLNIQLNNMQEGSYSIYVFDLNGRIVSNSAIDVSGNTNITTLSTSNWAAGIYNIVISGGKEQKIVSVVKH